MNPYRTAFTGRILSDRRLPPAQLLTRENNGLWRIRCEFPLDHPGLVFPLASVGTTGSGTMVFLSVLPDNRVRLGVDEWSIGGGLSPVIAVRPNENHLVEILVGPLARAARWPEFPGLAARLAPWAHSLVVWLDGQLVWQTDLKKSYAPSDPHFYVGENPAGFSSAQTYYPASIVADPYSVTEARDFMDRHLFARP
jgi:hypothetical protein